MRFDNGGRIGLSNPSTIAYGFTFGVYGTQSIGVERTFNSTGLPLSISAGGAGAGYSNLNGGNLLFASGVSTGSGTSTIQFQTYPGTASSTSDNSPITAMTMIGSGNVGVGITVPTAALQLKAGTAIAGTSPLKLTAGVNLTTPEPGAIEFDGTSLYYTDSSNARHALGTAGGSGTVSSATANQLAYYTGATTVSGLTSANNGVLVTSNTGVPSISSTLPSAVQTNITSLGTVTAGTWNGTAIGPTYGGTGVTSYATGDMLYASAANTLSAVNGNTSTTKKYLTSTGTGAAATAPAWGTLGASDLPTFTTFSAIASNGSGVLTAVPGTVNGSILSYSAAGPVFTTASFPTTTTANQLLYSSATNVRRRSHVRRTTASWSRATPEFLRSAARCHRRCRRTSRASAR